MKRVALANRMRPSLIVCGIWLASPFFLFAQETIQKPREEPPGKMSTQEPQGTGRPEDIVTEMQQRYKQMKKLRQEMTQALQQQMAALRAHTQALEGISDEQQLLGELRKHQHMTDDLLSTMIEQRATLDAKRKEGREQLWNQLGQTHKTEKGEQEGHDEGE